MTYDRSFAERVKRAMEAEGYDFDDDAHARMRGKYKPLLEHHANDLIIVCYRLEENLGSKKLYLERKLRASMTLDEMEQVVAKAL